MQERRMRYFFTETWKLIGLLASEYVWVRRGLYAAGTGVVLVLLWSLRPMSPERTAAHYLDALEAGNCGAAWRLRARQQDATRVNADDYESFESEVCETVSASYDKLYYEPWNEQEVNVFGNQAEVAFCACSLPIARSRRICALHNAVLVRQGMRWKIASLPIGPWDNKPCQWNRQRPEALIKPGSPQKRSKPGQ